MSLQPLANQYEFDAIITTTEMHTGGEPVRIIESGFPVPQGETILDKLENLKEHHDDYRKLTILEPRGHYDMFGVLLVTPDDPEADVAAIFMHNGGYCTMCGHVCVSLARYAVDKGLIRRPVTSPETQVNIQVPCGLVRAFVSVDKAPGRKTGRVRLESVPSFVVATDVDIPMADSTTVQVDISYSGAFYAFVAVGDLGLDFEVTSASDFANVGLAVKEACIPVVPLTHPDVPAYLHGVVFVDSRHTLPHGPSRQLNVFAQAETDRSPCGSGTTARVAILHHRGLLDFEQQHVFRNPLTGSEFIGRPVRDALAVGGKTAIIAEFEGQGHYTGRSTFHLEKDDVIGRGFLVR